MIEIELFYKIVESEIRRKHIKYLKRQKCLPSDQTEQIAETEETKSSEETVSMVSAAGEDDFIYSDKPKRKEKAMRVKAFNRGIETALNVLIARYKAFQRRLNKEEKDVRKF